MRRLRSRTVLAFGCLLLGALGLGACGSPATPTPKRRPQVSPVTRAEVTHEYASPPARRQTAADASRSAVAAVRAFASAYINWNARTVAADMRALADHSVGQARATVQLAAAEVRSDYELQRGGIANHGTVEALAPLRAGPSRYVVVTRERTTASAASAYQGLAPAWHVAVATVSRDGTRGWVVSGWQPEN